MYWSYSLWNSKSASWEPWTNWQYTAASTGSYQASVVADRSFISFAVYATNACGSSEQARESVDHKGIPLVAQVQDTISRNTTSSPTLKVGQDVDLYLVAASKLNLELTAKSLTSNVCTVNQTQILLNKPGICRLSVSSTSEFNSLGAKPTELQFEVTKLVAQSIPELNLESSYYLSTGSIELLLRTDASLTVRFKSQTTDTCIVLGSTLSLLNTGTCTLQASQEGDENTLAAPFRNFDIWIDSDPVKTITCIKGKLVKKITSASPKCPAGYKVKK